MIERALFITTDAFEVTSPKEHFINPRCFGEDFAHYLAAQMKAAGVEVSEPIQEDFGWVLLVGNAPQLFTLSLGVLDESVGRVPAVWRLGLAFEKPLNGMRSWFRRAPEVELREAFARVHGVLTADSRFELSLEEPA